MTVKTYGTVVLKSWATDPLTARQIIGVTGDIEIVTAKGLVGARFEVHNGEANWFARVRGGGVTWNLLGCQIRAIVEHPMDQAPKGEYIRAGEKSS